jgi:hypothetical protein
MSPTQTTAPIFKITAEIVDFAHRYCDNPAKSGPFRFNEYMCFTDGFSLIAIKSEDPCCEPVERLKQGLPNIFTPKTPASRVEKISVDLLRKWSEPGDCAACKSKRVVCCSSCKGAKKVECECACGDLSHSIKCTDCDATGHQDCRCLFLSEGLLFGMHLNMRRIFVILNLLNPAGDVRVSIFDKESFAHFDFEGSKGVLMALKSWDSEGCPVFDVGDEERMGGSKR